MKVTNNHITIIAETALGLVPMYFEDIPNELIIELKRKLSPYQVRYK